MVKIETPPMAEGDSRQQLQTLQSYLHRTAQQLQWAFEALEGGSLLPAAPSPREKAPASRQDPAAPVPPPEAPAPEEIFLSIKQLIIKSADIIEAYSEEIKKKLEGSFVAASEFGTYREKTSQELQADSKGIQQLFTHQGEIQSKLQEIEAQTASTRAYIRTGVLEEGTFPVYGLEIGQRNELNGKEVFNRYARFTSDRLSFYDASDLEVAYISDFKLYITNVQVAGELDLFGRFRVKMEGGLSFSWTGGQ